MFTKNTLEQSSSLVDQAAQSADHAIKSTQRVANDALDSLADSVRETSQQLRDKAQHASATTVNYVKHEPVKAILIAAATGAALMALVSLISHSRGRALLADSFLAIRVGVARKLSASRALPHFC